MAQPKSSGAAAFTEAQCEAVRAAIGTQPTLAWGDVCSVLEAAVTLRIVAIGDTVSERPHIGIYVSGGVVDAVRGNIDAEIIVADIDNVKGCESTCSPSERADAQEEHESIRDSLRLYRALPIALY